MSAGWSALPEALERAAAELSEYADDIRPANGDPAQLAQNLSVEAGARVLTWLLLTLAFYLVFTPFGLVMRILGKDPLHRRFQPDAATYWETRDDGPFDPDRLEKQY